MQKIILMELLKKLICNIMPIEFKLFAEKCLKLKELEAKDSLDIMIKKINDNQEM